jgi:murein tripeptide amidase MpaA
VEQLQHAYLHQSGIVLGGKRFSPRAIKDIVDKLDIIVFPQANPDGREWSMSKKGEAFWRKNRRLRSPNSHDCPGVDLNRNFDFLWKYRKVLSSKSDPLVSDDPGSKYFCGPSPFSEPECRNVRWILDKYQQIAYFIDLHSYGRQILYGWGDDEAQSSQPEMNFMNCEYDGDRGVPGDQYKEFIPHSDLLIAKSLARGMRTSIRSVRGTAYAVRSEFSIYPTTGFSVDYAYGRYFVEPANSKIISFTIEWGDCFHPSYAEMRHIIQEITAGLLTFCIKVQKGIH